MGVVSAPQLFRRAVALVLAAVAAATFAANDTRPVVGPGATRDDVIAAYGWPNGQSRSGTKEILTYAQGEVILENGRVERVDFSPDVPWQKPRPRPAPPTASTRQPVERPADVWRTDFAAAQQDAQRRSERMLVLFTGSDWSPASREFHEQVEGDPAFIAAVADDFVLVKLDYPRGRPVPAKISAENMRLRDQYDVTVYPTLLVLGPTGALLARVDWSKPEKAPFVQRVIAGVLAARDATGEPRPKPAAPAQPSAATAPAAAAPAPAVAPSPTPEAVAVRNAGTLVLGALLAGAAVVILALWWLWRPRVPRVRTSVGNMAERIDAAVDDVPSEAEMAAWPKEKLRGIVAGLAEFDNYTARLRPPGDHVDLELRKRSDVVPRVLVCCGSGRDGAVSAKPLRELFGALEAERVDKGWYVSPGGFTSDAKAYAAAHRIVLIAGDGLHAMMRDVPPTSLPGLLARE